MSLVTLVSGGLDSTVMALMAHEESLTQHPLFIDYGQRAAAEEWRACRTVFARHGLPPPVRMALGGFGKCVPTGLTSERVDVLGDAFLPGRNLLFLLAGAAYASHVRAGAVAIGLLDEQYRVFEDQSRDFLSRAEAVLRSATATNVSVVAPLMAFSKAAVLEMARERRLHGTYSCHAGTSRPCGKCLSCKERLAAEGAKDGR
jgi:7-cyano-7-deazaguanine synthase